MYKKLFFVLTIVLALVIGSFGSASAKPQPADPDCSYTPDGLTTEVGKEVQFHITNPDNSNIYTWAWNDGTEGETGQNPVHAWNGIGKFMMYVIASGPNGYNRCRSWVTVIGGNDMDDGMDFPTETPPAIEIPVIVVAADVKEIARGKTDGDGSPIINNIGDGTINITINPVTTATPAPLQTVPSNCNDSGKNSTTICASGNSTVTVDQSTQIVPTNNVQPAKPLTLGQKFWLPWKTFLRGVVTIIEGWFDLNIP